MKKAHVLVLTAGFGEGHNAAARALASALDDAHGPGTARLVDVFALASPRLNELSRRLYLGMINRTPRLWSAVYAWVDRTAIFPTALWFLRRELRQLDQILAQEQPAVLCSTYPVYAFLLEKLARDGRRLPPHFNIVTDSISINSLWWRAACAGWFLPNLDSADVMRRAGIDPQFLHPVGFPVTSFFSVHAHEFQPPSLGGGATPRVLYIINSGTRNALETATKLLAEPGWAVTCAVGRDEKLRARLEKLSASRTHPATILGWTDQIPRLLLTHHVVVSKAGGATTQEAIAARCPMIVNQIVPGQEEGNYELLRRHGVGALAETPDAIIRELRLAFAHQGRVWNDWRAALARLTRPDAARDIASHVLAHAASAEEPVPVPLQSCAAPDSPRLAATPA
jgi:processive 1,2-diacylglycerol beta-glucosyltransferase